MKMKQKFSAILIVLLLISNSLPSLAKTAAQMSKNSETTPDNALADDGALEYLSVATADDANMPAPGENPAFSAKIIFSPQGYCAEGTFKEFPPDISLVQPLYSLDGETWHSCERNWYLLLPEDMDNEVTVKKLQNQPCLYENQEPLKSYIAKQIDCFYLKLSLTRKNGITYETQTAVIQREGPKPLPEEFNAEARLSSSMLVRTFRPYSCYGRYQITVSEASTLEEISAFLPETLPIEIHILHENNAVASGTIDCPVTWKPLSLPELTAGESITIADAVEEISVPEDTVLDTPAGTFQLEQHVHDFDLSDEVRLVLNVIAKNDEPIGALFQNYTGLEAVFHLKPTGAAAIRAYVLTEGETEWTELSNVSFLETINAQPSTANSKNALLLRENQEPYRSYLEAEAAGNEPVPFFIGLKIEGGVYNGRQIILPWPKSYCIPIQLPALGGSGGNEGNAGADNKDDSTAEGQRPNLPQEPENSTGGQQTEPPSDSEGNSGGQQTEPPSDSEGNSDGQQTEPPLHLENDTNEFQKNYLQDLENRTGSQQTNLLQIPENKIKTPDTLNRLLHELLDGKRQQSPKRNDMPNNLANFTQPFLAMQTEPNFESGEKYPVNLAAEKAIPDIQTENPVQDTLDTEAQISEYSDFPQREEKSNLTEQPNRSKKSKYRIFLFLIAAAALAGICIMPIINKKAKLK